VEAAIKASKTRTRPRRGKTARGKRLWVRTVTTVSTAPPPGLFLKDARTIARTLASPRVSPKGITSGLRMLLFFINRAGRGLSQRRRAELLRAMRLMQEMVVRERRRERSGR
jgi:tRNA(adenine34) deaminase